MLKNLTLFLVLAGVLTYCTQQEKQKKVIIDNGLDFDRIHETVYISLSSLDMEAEQAQQIAVLDDLGRRVEIQLVDQEKDGQPDGFLFQPEVKAKQSATYFVKVMTEKLSATASPVCYSRFVPERIDDYAWENDRVAFRMYGPTAQRMKEEGIDGGIISSGIDCWLKKVSYPIINKWYLANKTTPGAYHIDHGEGLDDYHVGISRGCGGLAVKEGEQFFLPENYSAYNTLSTGKIRTAFNLDFAEFKVGDRIVKLSNHIELDKGSNLSKIVVAIDDSPAVAVGMAIGEELGEIKENKAKGWVSYWQKHNGSFLATAILCNPDDYQGLEVFQSDIKDESNVYINLKVNSGKVTYYSGFTWTKAAQFSSKAEWYEYLNQVSDQHTNPLQVKIDRSSIL